MRKPQNDLGMTAVFGKPGDTSPQDGKSLNIADRTATWFPTDGYIGQAALICWHVLPRKGGKGWGPTSRKRFGGTSWVGIDYDDTGETVESMLAMVRRNLGDVECVISSSRSGKKFHIVVRLETNIMCWDKFNAVKQHLAGLFPGMNGGKGGDKALQGFLIRNPNDPKYHHFAGHGFNHAGIDAPLPKHSKRRTGATRPQCDPSDGRRFIKQTVYDKAFSGEGLSQQVFARAGDMSVAINFPGKEKSAGSMFIYPDAAKGTMVHHSDRSKTGRYGRELSPNVARYVKGKEVCPAKFNRALSYARRLLCPKHVAECCRVVKGDNASTLEVLEFALTHLSVRTTNIKHNLRTVFDAFAIPDWVSKKFILSKRDNAALILPRIRAFINTFKQSTVSASGGLYDRTAGAVHIASTNIEGNETILRVETDRQALDRWRWDNGEVDFLSMANTLGAIA